MHYPIMALMRGSHGLSARRAQPRILLVYYIWLIFRLGLIFRGNVLSECCDVKVTGAVLWLVITYINYISYIGIYLSYIINMNIFRLVFIFSECCDAKVTGAVWRQLWGGGGRNGNLQYVLKYKYKYIWQYEYKSIWKYEFKCKYKYNYVWRERRTQQELATYIWKYEYKYI